MAAEGNNGIFHTSFAAHEKIGGRVSFIFRADILSGTEPRNGPQLQHPKKAKDIASLLLFSGTISAILKYLA